MANSNIKINYGINSVLVGTVTVTTIKLRVNRDFPFEQLPDSVRYHRLSSGKWEILYQGTGETARGVVQGVIKALHAHAQQKLNAKYNRMKNPIAYDLELEYQHEVDEREYYESELSW
jgi:hypothetical protein